MSNNDTMGFVLAGESTPIFETKVADLRKALTPDMVSNQGRNIGRVPHPIDFSAAHKLTLAVTTHEVCIATKASAIVGLGFETEEERNQRQQKKELENTMQSFAVNGEPAKAGGPKPPAKAKAPLKKEFPPKPEEGGESNPSDAQDGEESAPPQSKVHEILDPLCEEGFQSLMMQVGQDYETTGNGYIEVVRSGGDNGTIVALWHMPATAVTKINEEEKPFYHYEVDDVGGTLKYAPFGETARVRAATKTQQKQITELIHFKYPNSKHPHYGIPGYLAAVPWLELAQMLVQYNFDYFQNRAVPDLLVMITGSRVPDNDMKDLKAQIKETVGSGKRFRTIVSNIPHPDAKVQVERLNADNREKFTDLWTSVALEIVSAHRVPPLLAGVVLPGKMAASNELPNALVAFQTLYVAQHQKVFELKLGRTLGEAGLGLEPGDFLLKRITDFYDLGQVETMSRMRETAAEAQARGRELEDGLEE